MTHSEVASDTAVAVGPAMSIPSGNLSAPACAGPPPRTCPTVEPVTIINQSLQQNTQINISFGSLIAKVDAHRAVVAVDGKDLEIDAGSFDGPDWEDDTLGAAASTQGVAPSPRGRGAPSPRGRGAPSPSGKCGTQGVSGSSPRPAGGYKPSIKTALRESFQFSACPESGFDVNQLNHKAGFGAAPTQQLTSPRGGSLLPRPPRTPLPAISFAPAVSPTRWSSLESPELSNNSKNPKIQIRSRGKSLSAYDMGISHPRHRSLSHELSPPPAGRDDQVDLIPWQSLPQPGQGGPGGSNAGLDLRGHSESRLRPQACYPSPSQPSSQKPQVHAVSEPQCGDSLPDIRSASDSNLGKRPHARAVRKPKLSPSSPFAVAGPNSPDSSSAEDATLSPLPGHSYGQRPKLNPLSPIPSSEYPAKSNSLPLISKSPSSPSSPVDHIFRSPVRSTNLSLSSLTPAISGDTTPLPIDPSGGRRRAAQIANLTLGDAKQAGSESDAFSMASSRGDGAEEGRVMFLNNGNMAPTEAKRF
eukprot:gene10552-12204_t